jgi:ATP-dependent helicase/nuclease subunit A
MKEGCWYRLVRDALEAGDPSELVAADVPYAKALRWRPKRAYAAQAGAAAPGKTITLPLWLTLATRPATAKRLRILPSQFDPDDEPHSPYAQPTSSALDPRRRGDLLHRLLQRLPDLPADKRRDAAARFLAGAAGDITELEGAALVAEALRVIEHPELAALFGPQSRAEVDVLLRGHSHEIVGRIDRVACTPDEVLVADFKTGVPAPETAPLNYVRQLALYSDVLARIYPGKAMQALLVWTAGPAIHRIEPGRLKSAAEEAQQLLTLRPESP